jgi:hypothetical protein
LYATTSGASYERYEIERMSDPTWPNGSMVFKARLFADGGKTVVEQQIEWNGDGFWHDARTTTENDQPMVLPFTYFDGHVTLLAAHPWIMSDPSENANRRPFGRLIPEGPDVQPTTDGGERNDWDTLVLMADPKLDGAGCEADPNPADARSVAESLRANPDFRATAPVTASVGGARALMMDVKIATGTTISMPASEGGDYCLNALLSAVLDQGVGAAETFDSGVLTGRASGEWMRLHLLDAPQGSSMRTLAIAIVAPEASFQRAVDAAKPVIDSVEFRTP